MVEKKLKSYILRFKIKEQLFLPKKTDIVLEHIESYFEEENDIKKVIEKVSGLQINKKDEVYLHECTITGIHYYELNKGNKSLFISESYAGNSYGTEERVLNFLIKFCLLDNYMEAEIMNIYEDQIRKEIKKSIAEF